MKKVLLLLSLSVFLFLPSSIFANEQAVNKGIEYLKSKQDASGKITSGFSAPSQWAAIAFTTQSIDIATVKQNTASLLDFLVTDIPVNNAATDWETRLLAIVAIQGNPTNFYGTNYVQKLESFYTAGQIGDTCSLNDDVFGLLALIASGTTANESIKQHALAFLISKQDPLDGGFGFSAPGCDWYSTSSDMTAAGVQALVKAKESGMSHVGLDNAIIQAKNYLVSNQNGDGGFGYFGSSDTDTTGWVLIGLNALGMSNSEEATKAKTYLLSQQSVGDGGFMAFDYGSNTFVSNSTTTAQTLIAFSGKTWILSIYDASKNVQPLSTGIPSPTVTPTPTPKSTTGLTSIDQEKIAYQTITITTTPSPHKNSLFDSSQNKTTTQGVLGKETTSQNQTNTKKSTDSFNTVTVLSASSKNLVFLVIAVGSLFLSLAFFLSRKIRV